MARTPAQRKSLETKALANSVKSAGMRSLLEAGYTVTQVKDLFKAPYGFVYGVAQRAGLAQTAAARRAPRKAQAARPTKATSAKATRSARVQAREQKAAPAARAPKGRAQAAPAASSPRRGRGRPPVTDPKVIAQRSPDAQRAAARRAAAGSATVVSPLRNTRPVTTVRKIASANGKSAVARVAAKLQASQKGR